MASSESANRLFPYTPSTSVDPKVANVDTELSAKQLAKFEKRLRVLIHREALQMERRARQTKKRQAFVEWKLKHRISETPEQYWARIMRITQESLKRKK